MSTVVPVLSAESFEEDELAKRGLLRRRLMLAAVTVVLIAGLAGVPIPARRAFQELLGEISQLEDSVMEFRTEQRQLDAWNERIGEEPQDLADRARQWLSETDPIELRNRLIAVAGPCGLTLGGVAVEEGLQPLADEEVMESLLMVLGATADDDPFGDEEGDDPWAEDGGGGGEEFAAPEIPPLSATRYTISGHGPVSGVVLFSGLLRQLPEPLRLLSLDVTMDDGGARFTLVADRLSCSLTEELLEEVS
jgi:hypothetical protein